MNAVERGAIAKTVAVYIIDHLLYEPITAIDLESLAFDIIEDRKITDLEERTNITALAINYISIPDV